MLSEPKALRVRGLNKSFRQFDGSRQRVKQLIVPSLQKLLGRKPSKFYNEINVLNDISFDMIKGQTLGIMGKNGSGKSTLLQLIAGTLQPTSGEVEVDGRVSALLELGAGFNPLFTGRENVYLNGAIAGFSSIEIDEQFDEIAEFASIGEFIEQPVRTYSSGMFVRLAFACAIHANPDILIIDEALAVGDARFQLKCFRRLDELKSNGTTILFVSHATELLKSFCDHGIVLDGGKMAYMGDARSAILEYNTLMFPENYNRSSQPAEPKIKGEADLSRLEFTGDDIQHHTFGVGGAELISCVISPITAPNILKGGQKVIIECKYRWDRKVVEELISSEGMDCNITLGITLVDKQGAYIFGCNGFDSGLDIDPLETDEACVRFSFKLPAFKVDDYFLGIAIALGSQDQHTQLKWYDSAILLKIEKTQKNIYGLLGIDYQNEKIEERVSNSE